MFEFIARFTGTGARIFDAPNHETATEYAYAYARRYGVMLISVNRR